MARVRLTAGRIAAFRCEEGKAQSFLWCEEVPGLAVRATSGSSAKRYIFQTKVDGQSMRVTIGDVSVWSIPKAQEEARRLQVLIDQGNDPRQLKAEAEAAKEAERLAKEAEAAELARKQARATLTVAEAWAAYVAERCASTTDGKPDWGDRHRQHHESFVKAGGEKRTRGRRPGESDITRPGILVPLMSMPLAALDAEVIESWLATETARAPTLAAQAFRALRAFMTWCSTKNDYKGVVQADACQTEGVKKKVPAPRAKKNDSLRRAQIRPWFEHVRRIGNPVIAAYLQALLLTGARRNELSGLRWQDVDFQWHSLTIRDKVEGERTIPLTPYVASLLAPLPRRNEFVFSSPTSASGRIEEPRTPHNKALAAAVLPPLSLHGLRRSFDTLAEWVECPTGIVAQIMGHKPSAIAEKHYIQRELDLLHLWHVKIEAWILEQAGIEAPAVVQVGLRVVK